MTPTPIINPTTFPSVRFANISTLLDVLLPVIYVICGLVFGWMLLWSAYQVISAGGEQEKIHKAQQTATYAAIGILVVIVAATFVNIFGFITNIELPFL